MSIEAITAVAAQAVTPPLTSPSASVSAADFGAMIGNGITQADQGVKAADQSLRALAAGENIPLHDVMISMESARMNLMLMVEVRNRLVEAYQELMRMQL